MVEEEFGATGAFVCAGLSGACGGVGSASVVGAGGDAGVEFGTEGDV